MAHCCLSRARFRGATPKREVLRTKSIWQFFKFESEIMEQKFQEAYAPYTIQACHLWALAQVVEFIFHSLVISPWTTQAFVWVPLMVIFLTGAAGTTLALSGGCTPGQLRWMLNCGIAITMACLIWDLVSGYEDRVGTIYFMVAHIEEPLRSQFQQSLCWATSVLRMYTLLVASEVQAQPLIFIGFCPSTIIAFFIGPVSLLILSIIFHVSSYIPVVCAFTFAVLNVRQSIVISQLRRSLFRLEQHRIAQAEAARKTDGIINHILKNTMAEAKGLLETFCDVSLPLLPSDLAQTYIHPAIINLQAGLGWCKRRKVLAAILSGGYQAHCIEIPLEELIGNLILRRAVQVTHPGGSVKVDASVCDLILENALSNAFRHGHTTNPDVSLSVTCNVAANNKESLTFLIRNRIHPDRPFVSAELVNSILADFDPQNPMDMMFRGEGLRHCWLAARTLGIDDPQLSQTGDLVSFQFTVPASSNRESLTPSSSKHSKQQDDAPNLPPGLRVLILGDSASARTLIQHQVTQAVPNCTIEAFGDSPADMAPFVKSALNGADMVVLDQHLDWSSGDCLLGTEVAVDLLSNGFRGFLCLRTGNSHEEDVSTYWSSGVHCVLNETMDRAAAIATLRQSFHGFLEHRPKPQSTGNLRSYSMNDEEVFATSSVLPGIVPTQLSLQRESV